MAETMERYPAGYVLSLEQHVAALERTIVLQNPGAVEDHLSPPGNSPLEQRISADSSPTGVEESPQVHMGPGFEFERNTMSWPNPGPSPSRFDFEHNAGHSPPIRALPNFGANGYLQPASCSQIGNSNTHLAQLTIPAAASFFNIYFQAIHPQYPFLSLPDCGNWYQEWKSTPDKTTLRGWPGYFVSMILAIGSLVHSKGSELADLQHKELRTQAQMEQAIVTDIVTTPLIQLQAMLLSAMLALHGESTSRIAHISGAIIRFATMHDFHNIVNDGTDESILKIKAWSLDRLVSGILDVPMSLSDSYISTKLYEETAEVSHHLPWLADCPNSESQELLPNLGAFAHVGQIRFIQSKILHRIHSYDAETYSSMDWQKQFHNEISNWSEGCAAHLQKSVLCCFTT
ncbi:hypothetical protein BP5796_09395 [Coleophoma crateriformis]|uniref:Xylanolytic transcriptional activator regulatory domain-containing protein n=1 Tax=Coleophoma crateriformis TaxID=565419 RepID=A0A3D8QXX9_9HELO|nr:hypothetical protein BP5796_09395 [Coleophoma crateriformis]